MEKIVQFDYKNWAFKVRNKVRVGLYLELNTFWAPNKIVSTKNHTINEDNHGGAVTAINYKCILMPPEEEKH